MVKHVTDAAFDTEVRNAKGLVIVDFWAEWCGPCKRYGPIFEEASQELAGKASFVKIDVEANPGVASELGVQSIPTTMFFKDGQEVGREAGILSKELLKQAIAHYA